MGELRRLLREVVAGCCLCICGHRCRKDPRVIGGDYCVACRWCQCTEHRAASEGTATTPPERRALDLDEVLRRHRNVARAMHENGTPEDVLRGWRAFAGWLRAGMPDEPDVRGSAPTDDTTPPDPEDATLALCNLIHAAVTSTGHDCPESGAAVLCYDLAAALIAAGVVQSGGSAPRAAGTAVPDLEEDPHGEA